MLGVARRLGRAERGVALDDEQLGVVDVVAPAVGQLGGQRARLQRVLAALGVALLPCEYARARGGHDLLEHLPRLRALPRLRGGQERLELARDDAVDDARDRSGAEDVLGRALRRRR